MYRQFSQTYKNTVNMCANTSIGQEAAPQAQQLSAVLPFSGDNSSLSPQASAMQSFSFTPQPYGGSNSGAPTAGSETQPGSSTDLDTNAQNRINSLTDFINSLFGGSGNSTGSDSGFGIPTVPTTPSFPDLNPALPGTNDGTSGMSNEPARILGYDSIKGCDDSTQALADELITTGQCTAEQLTILQLPDSADKYNEVTVDQGDNGGIVVTVNGEHQYNYTADQAKSLIISGGSGTDRIYGYCSNDLNIAGGDGHNVIRGGSGNDIIYGGSDSDHIYGGGGNDEIFGGNGFDKLYGGTGNDYIYGGRGNDVIDGGRGYDTIYGGAGDDKINGGSDYANDVLYGGDGSDTFGEGENLTNYRHDTIKDQQSYDTLAYRDPDGRDVYDY
ncbi:hypothetical protein IJT93_00040 [bacterium]|nr:hypothetical protein [bacterium]